MNTTSLLIELLISGLAFLFSLFPIIAYLFDVDIIEVMKIFSGLALPYQLLLIYALGIIWNRVCDEVFWPIEEKIIKHRFTTKENFTSAKIRVFMKENSSMVDYLGKIRSLLRITRIISVFPLISLIELPLIMHYGHVQFTIVKLLLVIFIGMSFAALSSYTWYRFQRSYVKVVFYAHLHMNIEENRIIELSKLEGGNFEHET